MATQIVGTPSGNVVRRTQAVRKGGQDEPSNIMDDYPSEAKSEGEGGKSGGLWSLQEILAILLFFPLIVSAGAPAASLLLSPGLFACQVECA